MTKLTSASGSAPASSAVVGAEPAAEPASSLLVSSVGTLAESSDVVSERLAMMRTNGRMRTTSRSPTLLVTEARMSCRALGASATGWSLSALRVIAWRSGPMMVPRSEASKRSGMAAKLASRSSAA
jgi:hypothetical protein